MSAILAVRLTKEEQDILAKRSKRVGLRKSTFVRKLICDQEINGDKVVVTSEAALAMARRNWGNARLRITPCK